MFRRSAVLFNDFPSVTGGPVLGLGQGFSQRWSIRPTIATEELDRNALELKMSSLLAQELAVDEEEGHGEPPLRRNWVKAPASQLSTSASRRDWFRLMSFNMMTDAWGSDHTTPVEGVKVRVPSFTRETTEEASAEEGLCQDKTTTSAALPPFLSSEYRRNHLVTLLRHYDPDIVCLNEVNRPFFQTEMWRYVRFLGYGTLYQSSRGARVRALRHGASPNTRSSHGTIAEGEDIGNAMLFHKGRFFPLMMPGRDIGRQFHFAHFVAMRDKVTNMTLYVACLQLTAGATPEAVEVRAYEAKQVLTLLDAMMRNDTERSHMSPILCGDLNNHTDDEPCVELLRGRFFSTHDVVGGPRWTAWHHRDPAASERYGAYFRKNREEMHCTDGVYAAEEEIVRFRRQDTGYHGKSSQFRLVRAEIEGKMKETTGGSTTAAAPPKTPPPAPLPSASADSSLLSPAEASSSTSFAGMTDQLALTKASREAKGINYNTQDFIFYDPRSLALHQVLDVPEDSEIDQEQLFPNHKLPSHHLPLLVDVSWNDTFPDVGTPPVNN